MASIEEARERCGLALQIWRDELQLLIVLDHQAWLKGYQASEWHEQWQAVQEARALYMKIRKEYLDRMDQYAR